MASHSGPGPSTTHEQNQSHHQIQINVIKTMIAVSATYVITWTPTFVLYVLQHIVPSRRMYLRGYYVPVFLAFLYLAANPFIYAINFHPVKRVLVRLIPWKNSPQPSADTNYNATRAVGIRTTKEH